MTIKGFLVLFGPEFGKWKDKDGTERRYEFNSKFFEFEEQAEKSLGISLQKARKHGWEWTDYKMVRIECEGKELT